MADSSGTVTSSYRRRNWYCHSCEESTNPTPEYTCSRCQSGFIEQIHQEEDTSTGTGGPLPTSLHRISTRNVPYRRTLRRAHIAVHRLQPTSSHSNSIRDFVDQVIATVTGAEMTGSDNAPGTSSLNVLFAPPILMGRLASHYVVSADGLDNVITMLLNQLDEAGTGAPPASEDQIDALPTIGVMQEQVDASLQCNICMEDFTLNERVRSLPCKHIYHGLCITPWLQLHDTCPICRRSITLPTNVTESELT